MINSEKNGVKGNSSYSVIKLLKNAALHLRYVITMVEEKKYCMDVIQESREAQRYLRLVDKEMKSNHLKTCVIRLLNGKNKEQQLQEILNIFKKGGCYKKKQ